MASYRCRLVNYSSSLPESEQPKPGDMWFGDQISSNLDARRSYQEYVETLREREQESLPKSPRKRARELDYRHEMRMAEDLQDRLMKLSEADVGKRPLIICLPDGEEYELGLVGQGGKVYRRARESNVVNELAALLRGRELSPPWTGTPPDITLSEKISTRERGEWWIRKGMLTDDVIGGIFEDLFQSSEN